MERFVPDPILTDLALYLCVVVVRKDNVQAAVLR